MRNPAYRPLFVAGGLALNSLLSILPGQILVAMLACATAIEDLMLREELASHADYPAKVCYRLIPGIW